MVSIFFAKIDSFDIASDFKEAFILWRTAQYKGQARRISRHGTGQGKCLIFGPHIRRRDDDDFMGEQNARLIAFVAADDNAVIPYFIDVDVHIWIRLLMGSQRAQSFDIGHRNRTGQVVTLYIVEKFHETVKIPGSQIVIHVIAGRSQPGKGF